MGKPRKIRKTVAREYNPVRMRRILTQRWTRRFFKLFCESLGIEREGLTGSEYLFILRQLWENGSFAVSKMVEPIESEDTPIVFSKYAARGWDLYGNPLWFDPVPFCTGTSKDQERQALALSKETLRVGKNGIIVPLTEEALLNYGSGGRKMAEDYISQIVVAEMSSFTNVMLQKMPFLGSVDQADSGEITQAINQIVNDDLSVFVSASSMSKISAANFNVPVVFPQLANYIVSLENMFLDEIGVDNANGGASPMGMDRGLVDEVNANNSEIQLFARGRHDCLEFYFKEVKDLFGHEIKLKPLKAIASVHEEINEKKGESDDDLL
jgi:hypothetical protein